MQVNERRKKQHQNTSKFKDSLVADIFLIIIWCATMARRMPTPIFTPTERIYWDKILLSNILCTTMFIWVSSLLHFQKSKLFSFYNFNDLEMIWFRFLDIYWVKRETHVTTILPPLFRQQLPRSLAAFELLPRFAQPASWVTNLHRHRCLQRLQNHRRCHCPPKNIRKVIRK